MMAKGASMRRTSDLAKGGGDGIKAVAGPQVDTEGEHRRDSIDEFRRRARTVVGER